MITRPDLELYWNEWLSTLLNKIGLTVIHSKLLTNKLAAFKTGSMEFGDIIEEIGVDIKKPKQYEGPELYGEGELCLPNPYCKSKPITETHFHRRNRQEYYEETIFRQTLRKSFDRPGGLTTFVDAIITAIYSSANEDEYLYTKEMFSHYINTPDMPLNPNQLVALNSPITDNESGKAFILAIKLAVENLSFNSPDFNPLGFTTQSDPDSLILVVRKGILPLIDVETLAGAFNPGKLGTGVDIVTVDDFGSNTVAADGSGVVAMLLDRQWSMIKNNLTEFHTIFNPKGLYWNYFYHRWETYAASYMKNAIIFTQPAPLEEVTRAPVSDCTLDDICSD